MFPGVPSVRRGWMKFDPPRAQHSPSSEGYLVKATDITRSSHYRHLPPRPPETLTEENPQGATKRTAPRVRGGWCTRLEEHPWTGPAQARASSHGLRSGPLSE